MNKYIQHVYFREWVYFFLCHGFKLVGWVSKKYHGDFTKGLTMSPLAIYKFNFSKMANFDIFPLIKQYTNFGCSSSYLRFSHVRWDLCDRATSVVLSIVVTGLLVLVCHIGLINQKISTGASSNSWWAPEEVRHATLTPLGRFDVYVVRSDGIDDPGGDIVLVLEKVESELKVKFFWQI